VRHTVARLSKPATAELRPGSALIYQSESSVH
jgi:hypothetical protein